MTIAIDRRTVATGVIVAVVGITNTFAYAAFLASGPNANEMPTILASALLSTAIMSCVLARFHSVPSALGGPAGNAAAVVGAALSAVLGHEALASRRPADVAVVLALTALLPAAAMLVLAKLRLSRAIRYMPYPVVAGFFAGTGWLMIVGSLRIAHGAGPIVAAIAFAAAVRVAQRRIGSPLLIPGAVLAATLAVYAGLAATNTRLAAARADGWLYERMPAAGPALLTPDAVVQANWIAVAGAWSAFAWVVIVVVIVSLMNGAALELENGTDSDVDRDMAAAGAGNLIAGLCGGFGSQVVLPTSLLALVHARSSRVPALVVAAAAIGMMAGAGAVIPLLSPAVFGGVIALFGWRLIEQYVIAGLQRMPHAEFAAVLAMLVCTATAGLRTALIVGSIVACLTFTAYAGRQRIIRSRQTLRRLRSRVERPRAATEALDRHSHTVEIVRLQGHLFFGSANALFTAIADVLDGNPDVRIVVLDLAAVHAVDVSAALTFEKLRRRATQLGTEILCGIAPLHERMLRASGALTAQAAYAHIDDALEACENRILAEREYDERYDRGRSPAWFERDTEPRRYHERRELAAGESLFVNGTSSDELFFLIEGTLSVVRGGDHVRTLLPGSLVGEVAFFTGEPHSATIIAAESAAVVCLSRAAFEAMERDDPRLHAAVARDIMRAQADRMHRANSELSLLRA